MGEGDSDATAEMVRT
ncbi:Protein of unknown function [Propionibacterium freudenreichii subsp. freudenreichii]|uniref:Uncharacterized protein n=1 Tax=Propionibacterium freudenreichii subsp. freudenreichii TaxID=66712 RepID=A0A0B7NUX3_PROFF|nr:Protein of unknown function [Propionibacterium freudenreichii]CEH08171.1 Protein of unknown function [Propionibacterium freudenreichii]CEP26491.1 Protein of unknown function [Propionibacterium freudenreichii subsp. freudenreichii]